MAWTNLPTDYTDATFTGLRRYSSITNADGTISFVDVTVYDNVEKSFFGANDANRMNQAINDIMSSVNETPTMEVSQITLRAASWVNHGDYYTQSVSLEVEANDRIDLHPDAVTLVQLLNDGVAALFVENDGGVLTAYSVGGTPSVDLTVQASVVGVPV